MCPTELWQASDLQQQSSNPSIKDAQATALLSQFKELT